MIVLDLDLQLTIDNDEVISSDIEPRNKKLKLESSTVFISENFPTRQKHDAVKIQITSNSNKKSIKTLLSSSDWKNFRQDFNSALCSKSPILATIETRRSLLAFSSEYFNSLFNNNWADSDKNCLGQNMYICNFFATLGTWAVLS